MKKVRGIILLHKAANPAFKRDCCKSAAAPQLHVGLLDMAFNPLIVEHEGKSPIRPVSALPSEIRI